MNKLPDQKPHRDHGGSAATRGGNDDPALQQGEAPRVARPREIGGRDGPEPTRFGDWEKDGRCIDF